MDYKTQTDKYWSDKLTVEQYNILRKKYTEPRKKGKPEFDKVFPVGTYHCVGCDNPLFDGKSRFECGCGWPAFDNVINNSVIESLDSDGQRTEVLCSKCDGHLGHVFRGENLTPKNVRYCINECVLVLKN
jgi:methionine-R-sulfoxide reductase